MKEIQEILAKIKPGKTEQQKMKKTAAAFIGKIKVEGAQAVLGGSGAKDTWLSGSHDVDIFVMFNYQKFADKSAELPDLLQPVLKKAFPGVKRVHGSRDYFQVKYKNINFEVVPILEIRKAEEAKNITDISPLHAAWVKKKVKDKDQVRLAKQFFKAHQLYGAESHIRGFSGYVTEILIAYYGSLENLLKASQQWTVKEVIDIEKHYPDQDILFHLNKSKTQSPLIVIDPVDKNRNASAALSDEKFFILKKVGREYLQKPDRKFFVREGIDFAKLKREGKANLIFITLIPLAGKEDVVGTKILKIFEYLKKKLLPFKLKEAGWDWDKMYFFTEKREIPKEEVLKGPPLKLEEHVKRFRKKYKDYQKAFFEEKGRLMVKVPAKNPCLEKYVAALLKEKYVKEKVKGIKVKVD